MVHKMALIRGIEGLDVRFYVRDPKKAHPWPDRRVLAYFASKSVQGRWLLRVARTPPKKNQKTNTFLVRKVTHVRRRNAWADCDLTLARNHVCRFVLRSLTGFGHGGWSNFGFLHWVASSPLQLPCECVMCKAHIKVTHLFSLLFHAGQAAIKLPSAEASKRAQCTSPGQYTLTQGNNENSLELIPIKEIITSQELDQHSEISTTKAKGYILL